MPATLQAFIWILGIGVIGILLTIVGFLIKDKLDAIRESINKFESTMIKLFEKDDARGKEIGELRGEIKVINERCKNRDCV